MRDRIFFAFCFGFMAGVLLRSFIFINIFLAMLLPLFALAMMAFGFIAGKSRLLPAAIFMLALPLGVARFHQADILAPDVTQLKTEFSGIIVDEPDIRVNNQKLSILTRAGEKEIKVLVTTDFGQDFKYGDEIKLKGVLEKPENFITDQGKNFDYINYLRKDGIYYVVAYPEIEIFSRGNGNKIKSALFAAKEKFLAETNLAIRPPESLLLGGLILGERASMSGELRQSFIDTGTIHIVALSGYNITIVADWFMKFFAFLPRNFGFGAGILSILLFVLMTGGSSTAIRAGIMATLVLFARLTGRNYDAARALVLAAVIMILINPFVLVFDVSFELSFLATIAVIFLTPRIEKYFRRVPKFFGLREIISITTAAYLFVLPFILYKMGNLSLVALPANILILPFIPLTMGLGFLTGFAGLISYVLAVPAGFITYLFLHYELAIISFFSHLPFSAFVIPSFPFLLTLFIYAYFIYKLFGANVKNFFKPNRS